VFEGQFFSEFNEDIHVIDAHVIPKNTGRFIAFDYGFDMLAVLLLAKDTNGNIYVERELCKPNLTLGEAAQEIVRFISSTSVEYAVASPDLWNRRQDSGKSGVEIMQSVYGMPQMVAADDRRIPGWRALKEYLSQREDKPRLYICKECHELIHSMQSLLCDKNRIEDAASEPHSITHAPEALRYAVMSRYEYLEAGCDKLPFNFMKKKTSVSSFLSD
jgi:phage terminase large subunit